LAKSTKKQKKEGSNELQTGPWIKMRTGVILIAIISVFMAVATAWEAIPAKGLWEGILWGVIYGVFIWVIFFGFLFVNRNLRR
jgi:sterol desaturase/sphingolipid hydroxylase (fatty acid hydroxylase superfamily)